MNEEQLIQSNYFDEPSLTRIKEAKMEELIKKWERLAEGYEKQANEDRNNYAIERLLTWSDAYRACADELRRALND